MLRVSYKNRNIVCKSEEHGNVFWDFNGLRHRLDGPAIEWNNVDKEWYINGILYTKEQFDNKVKEKQTC